MKFKREWNNRILVVDDQENIHQDIEEMLKPGLIDTTADNLAKVFGSEVDLDFLPDFDIIHAKSGNEAYDKVKHHLVTDNPIAVAYIDMRMPPGWDGVETIRKIREIDKNIEIVIMTAYTDKPLSEIIYDMELLNKLLYIRKPFAREEIQQMTISLVEKWNVELELEMSRQRLESVINSTRDSIGMYDVSGILVFANRRYLDMFGLAEESLRDMPKGEMKYSIRQRFQDPDRFEKIEESFFLQPEVPFEDIIEVKEPERKMLYLFTAPVYDSEEKIIGRIVVFRDITKEIEIEEWKAEVLRLRSVIEKEYSFDKIIGRSKKMKESKDKTYLYFSKDLNMIITNNDNNCYQR